MVPSKYGIERRILIGAIEDKEWFFQNKYSFLSSVTHSLSKEGITWWEISISSCWGQMRSVYRFIHSEYGDWSQAEKAAVVEEMAKEEWNQKRVQFW